MKIVEYEEKYSENVKDLLVELQEYIVSIDREGYNIITSEYREKYFDKTMDEVNKYNGKIFLAKDEEKVIGLIIGLINNEEESTYDFKAPKRGRITELVVSKNTRSSGVGTLLMEKMESHFKNVGCKGILLDVFAYNENAKKFYDNKGYFTRTEELMKKI